MAEGGAVRSQTRLHRHLPSPSLLFAHAAPMLILVAACMHLLLFTMQPSMRIPLSMPTIHATIHAASMSCFLCFLHPASCILHLASCFLHPASSTHASCILHLASNASCNASHSVWGSSIRLDTNCIITPKYTHCTNYTIAIITLSTQFSM